MELRSGGEVAEGQVSGGDKDTSKCAFGEERDEVYPYVVDVVVY